MGLGIEVIDIFLYMKYVFHFHILWTDTQENTKASHTVIATH